MRLRTALAAAAALCSLAVAAAPSSARTPLGVTRDVAAPGREPRCGDATAAAFPITTRITGGPAVHRAGEGFSTWRIELTNTTAHPCRNIHPVIVLTDRNRRLTPAQVRLEFAAREGGPRRPVRVERTDAYEIVGVLDDDTDRTFTGFTVPARGTVTVPVRLGFTADARPDQVTANAAIVQRRGDDGEWVGESGDYRFAVVPENAEEGEEPDRADETGAAPSPLPEGEELAGTGTRRGHAHLLPLATAATGCLTLGAGALLLAARARRRP